MIKTAIIFVLLILLLGGAFLSRPTRQAFEAYAREQLRLNNPGFLGRMIGDWQLDGYLNSIDFKDRFLWVEVRQNNRLQFIGAFSKFFSVASKSTEAVPAEQSSGT